MSIIRDGRIPIELDKTRHLLCSLYALDEFQDQYGGIEKLGEVMYSSVKVKGKKGQMVEKDFKPKYKNIGNILTLLLNEGAEEGDEELTYRQVSKLVHIGNVKEVMEKIFEAFNTGFSDEEDQSEEQEDLEDEENEEVKNV